MHLLLIRVKNASKELEQRLVLQVVDTLRGARDEELHPLQHVALETLAAAAFPEEILQFLHLPQVTRLGCNFITNTSKRVQLVVLIVRR